jgi:hypothetical protein
MFEDVDSDSTKWKSNSRIDCQICQHEICMGHIVNYPDCATVGKCQIKIKSNAFISLRDTRTIHDFRKLTMSVLFEFIVILQKKIFAYSYFENQLGLSIC